MPEMKPSLEVNDNNLGNSFRFQRCGWPNDSDKWHFHPEYELHQIVRTSGKLFIGDNVLNFRPGSLFLIGPYTPHNFVSDARSGAVVPERDLILQFRKEWIEASANVLTELRLLRPAFDEAVFGVEYGGETQQAVYGLMNRIDSEEPLERLISFMRIIDHLKQCRRKTVLGTSRYFIDMRTASLRRFNKVVDYIREHIEEDVSMEEAADLVGMSYKMFSRWFIECTGIGFRRYVIKTRINKSCEYLFSTSRSIQEICYLVGFNNVSNYNRLFRQVIGVTPSEFRRKSQEAQEYEFPLEGFAAA
ncbi:AraC family transcriptional regulator [uncultured Pleomorphomonas sp.]|uniref:AraC family transcriptional regulator n=1 Tax=uncultured Pleomorphomonas sp. TaxID=442121 RepID=A0A212LC26_9HYPH|nr:AraC family transcriptional regulator [uncultured Pleomorphomonas sp.]SCM75060.1 AraC family transcriptional regulator [uncultured Pleomorphomonas sp.]